MKRSNWLIVAIIVLLVICVAMLVFYFYNVTNHFSTDSNDWGNFGGYLGSITGILAFAGVLYSIQRSNKVHTEDSERNVFFQLLELHTKKTNSIMCNEMIISSSPTLGFEAFKEYTNIANGNLNYYLLCDYLLGMEITRNNISGIDDQVKRMISYINSNIEIKLNEETTYEDYLGMRNTILNKKKWKIVNKSAPNNSYLDYFIEQLNINEKYQEFRYIGELLYKYYGHILGHYFRNMFYVMDTISKFSDQKNYKEIFRAQLSRYELVIALFNAVGSHSSTRMVELLEKFDIFKDIYPDDLYILKISDDPQKLIKDILSEYKKEMKRVQTIKS